VTYTLNIKQIISVLSIGNSPFNLLITSYTL